MGLIVGKKGNSTSRLDIISDDGVCVFIRSEMIRRFPEAVGSILWPHSAAATTEASQQTSVL